MADDVQIFDANGVLRTIATDELAGGRHFQRAKTALGPDGTGNDALDAANAANGNNGAGVAAVGGYVYNGATWDRVGDGSLRLGGAPLTGTLGVVGMGYNQNTANWERESQASGDGLNTALHRGVVPMLYNGSTVDRQRGNFELGVAALSLASAARTASTSSSTQTNFNHRGVQIVLWCTAAAGSPPTLAIRVDNLLGGTNVLFQDAARVVGAGNNYIVTLYPGIVSADHVAGGSAVANVGKAIALPRTWGITIVHSNANSITYSVTATLIV